MHFIEDKLNHDENPHMKPFLGKNMTNQSRIDRLEKYCAALSAAVEHLKSDILLLEDKLAQFQIDQRSSKGSAKK